MSWQAIGGKEKLFILAEKRLAQQTKELDLRWRNIRWKNIDKWFTRTAASKFLGCSIKTLEKALAAKGKHYKSPFSMTGTRALIPYDTVCDIGRNREYRLLLDAHVDRLQEIGRTDISEL